MMLFDWIHSGIPRWNPEISPKYLRHSQTLMVPPPEGPSECRGIVHFQSASEPLWSDEDVIALKESGAAWALLILSPFQRPDEVETRVDELTDLWDRVVVWRPDLPSLAEARALRRIAPAYSIPTRGGASWRRTRAKARRLLRGLYVERGLLLTSADHWSPSAELENDSLASLLSRTLLSVSGTPGTPLTYRREGAPAASEKVLAWAALLSDDSVRPESEVWGERHLLSWWATRLEVDCSPLMSRLHNLPEAFATIRMGQEIRFFESSLGLIRSALQRLRNRELSLTDAIGQIAAHFGDDESRLLKWRKSLDNFTGLVRWLPAYEYAHDYVRNAFGTGQPDIDDRRADLLERLRQPQRFLEAAHRDAFDNGFLQFKTRYIESYSSLHEEAIGRIQTRLDPASIRSLELLSRLEHADTTSSQKIQLIAKWARSNQCDLPVREILDRYPRCYCNFNPAVPQHVTDPVSRINSLVQEGTEYFRTVLRNTRNIVIDELALQDVGDEVGRQVASLLGRGPLVPIGPETLEALNRIIQKHSDQFRSEFHSQRPKAKTAK